MQPDLKEFKARLVLQGKPVLRGKQVQLVRKVFKAPAVQPEFAALLVFKARLVAQVSQALPV